MDVEQTKCEPSRSQFASDRQTITASLIMEWQSNAYMFIDAEGEAVICKLQEPKIWTKDII